MLRNRKNFISLLCLISFISCVEQKEAVPEENSVIAQKDLNQFFKQQVEEPTPSEEKTLSSNKKKKELEPPKFIEAVATSQNLTINNIFSVRVFGVWNDGVKRSITTDAVFNIEDTKIIENISPGSFLAKYPGDSKISFTYLGISKSLDFKITKPNLVGVELTPKTMVVGANQQLKAIALYSDGTSRDVTKTSQWASSNQDIAKETEVPGLLNGVSKGEVSILISSGSKQSSHIINVNLMPIESITITGEINTLQLGTSIPLKAIANYVSGTTGDITKSVAWTSSDPSVLEVSDDLESKGLVTAVGGGTAQIQAIYEDDESSFEIVVTTISFASYEILPGTLKVPLGGKLSVFFEGTLGDGSDPQDITQDTRWSIDKDYIASISNEEGTKGEILPISIGTANIKALFGNDYLLSVVEVTEAAIVEIEISSSIPNPTCGVNNPNLSAEGKLSDGTTSDITDSVTWSVQSEAFGIIANEPGSEGELTTLAAGTVTAIATYWDPILEKTIVGKLDIGVSAPNLIGYTVTAPASKVAIGSNIPFKASGKYSCDTANVDFSNEVTWSTTIPELSITVAGAGSTAGETEFDSNGTVDVELNGLTGSMPFAVQPKKVTGVEITAAQMNVDRNTQRQFTAKAKYSNGSSVSMTDTTAFPGFEILWQSNDEWVGTVDNVTTKGMVQGIKEGTFLLSAQLTLPDLSIVVASERIRVRSVCNTGTKLGLFCYFHAEYDQSCSEFCATKGTYVDASIFEIGSEGARESCRSALIALALPTLSSSDKPGPDNQGLGCSTRVLLNNTVPERYVTPETDPDAKHANVRRICSCSE